MLVVEAVEERELLLAVGRVVGRVGVDRDDVGHAAAVFSLEPLDAELDREIDRPEDRSGRHRVLEPGERGLAREGRAVGEAVGDHLEDGVVTERVVVVAVLVSGDDAVDALAGHGEDRVDGVGARVAEALGEPPRPSDALVELPDDEQTPVGGQRRIRPAHDGRAWRGERERDTIGRLR